MGQGASKGETVADAPVATSWARACAGIGLP